MEQEQGAGQSDQAPEPETKNRRRIYGCLIIVGAITALLVLIGLCNALLNDGASSVPATATPRPAPTQSCSTPAEQNYLTASRKIRLEMAVAMADVRRLMETAQSEPSAIVDEEWRAQTAVGLDELFDYSLQLEELTPPDSLRSIHATQSEMSLAVRGFVASYGIALDFLDEASMAGASGYLDEIQESTALLNAQIARNCP